VNIYPGGCTFHAGWQLRHQRFTLQPLALKPLQQFHLPLLVAAGHQDQILFRDLLRPSRFGFAERREGRVGRRLPRGLQIGVWRLASASGDREVTVPNLYLPLSRCPLYLARLQVGQVGPREWSTRQLV
jgi:hypothetical protein